MSFGGFKGKIIITGASQELKELILQAEPLHIGKNTVFGLGKYFVK